MIVSNIRVTYGGAHLKELPHTFKRKVPSFASVSVIKGLIASFWALQGEETRFLSSLIFE